MKFHRQTRSNQSLCNYIFHRKLNIYPNNVIREKSVYKTALLFTKNERVNLVRTRAKNGRKQRETNAGANAITKEEDRELDG